MSAPGTADGAFAARSYPDVVRDLLTTLTGGTVRETAVVPAGDVVELRLLADRPIRRVSHLEGVVAVERRDEQGGVVAEELPYRFTDADFELVSTGQAGTATDAVRFRPGGRRPPPGSTVTVNYYPAQTRPVPLTDVTVGSVVRTLMESVARELALQELQLEQVYRSAFVETAQGSALDKVVALVGVSRRPPGVATVHVRFERAAGSSGRIAVPVGTVVADKDGNRYATTAPLVVEPGEPSRQVLAAAVTPTTPAVAAGALDRPEVVLAGVAKVVNDADAAPAAAPETDEELRVRARGALAVAARGTLDALRYGLLSVPGVKAVALTEMPHGVPGEVSVDVAYERDDPDVRARVEERIEDLRPAGVRVVASTTTPRRLVVGGTVTLAGAGLPRDETATLMAEVETRLAAYVDGLPPGGTLRVAQLVSAVLVDPRVADADLAVEGGGAAVVAEPGTVLRLQRPVSLTVATESGDGGGQVVELDVYLPVHPVAGVTAAEATTAAESATRSWAAGLGTGSPLSVDTLVAAVRDDTRYAVLRAEATVTTRAGERFRQLGDGLGVHELGPADRVQVSSVVVDVREGAV